MSRFVASNATLRTTIFVALVPLGTLSLSLSSPPPPPPLPPRDEISSLSARPSSSLPCIARFADLAAPGESNSTKPNPRDRFAPPGPFCVATVAANTRPEAAAAARRK